MGIGKLGLAAMAVLIAGAAVAPASADDDWRWQARHEWREQAWREHQRQEQAWREHEWRERQWREHEWRQQTYARPPVTWGNPGYYR